MPKTRSQTKKDSRKENQPRTQLTTFGSTGNQLASVIDRSKFELSHPKIQDDKMQEVKKMEKKPHMKPMSRKQKKQMGMKRNLNNIRQTFQHHHQLQ